MGERGGAGRLGVRVWVRSRLGRVVESEAPLLWCSPAGALQGTARPRYVLETVYDVFGGHLVCGGISFYPHARPRAGGAPTSRSGLRVQGCQCTTLPPQSAASNLSLGDGLNMAFLRKLLGMGR